MKRILVVFALAFALFAELSPATAQLISGAQLLDFCQASLSATSDPADDWKKLSCAGVIYGFTSAHETVRNLQAEESVSDFKPLYCAPKDTSVGDYITIFTAYALVNRDKLSVDASQSLFPALMLAFPCPWLVEKLR